MVQVRNYDDNLCAVTLTRFQCSKYGTFGTLNWDGLELKTLEPVRPIIPVGHYLVTFTYSPKFGSKNPYRDFGGNVPLLNGVPGHEGIRIHVGNISADTSGCILVGMTYDDIMIYDSRKAYRELMQRIQIRQYYNKNTFFVLEVKDEK